MPRGLFALVSVALTGLLVAVGIGVVPPQATPDVSASVGSSLREPSETVPAKVASGRSGALTIAPAVALEPQRSPTELPRKSGDGRRVVFSQDAQRVWLVEADGTVARTYLVSGSTYDNLQPGNYAVFSRSEQAWGIDDSGTMRNFVRFAHGPNAAIGFHDIPVFKGKRVQTEKQLGTPLSHGCVRQATADALALWEFAPIGTRVVVI